jgi:hypothetical protein
MPTTRMRACVLPVCTIGCYHGLRLISFLAPTAAPSVASPNWCLAAGLPPCYTLDVIQHHRKKSDWFKSGDQGGHATSTSFLIHLPPHLRSKIPSPLCRHAEVFLQIVVTLVFVLQEPQPLRAAVIYFPENSTALQNVILISLIFLDIEILSFTPIYIYNKEFTFYNTLYNISDK